MDNFDSYNALLAIATHIPLRLLLYSRDTFVFKVSKSLPDVHWWVNRLSSLVPVHRLTLWACFAGVVRSAGDGHVGALAPQHGCASGCGLVSALRCCGSAVPAHASPGALRRVHQQPEELSRGCERLQLRHGCSAGGCASVSSGHPTLQGQGLTLPSPHCL